MALDVSLDEQQLALRAGARQFADGVLAGVAPALADIPGPEERCYAIKPFCTQMVAAGFLEALIPNEYGGEYMNSLSFVLADPKVGVRTFAELDGDEWVINGAKHYTTNGSGRNRELPDVITLVCRTDPDKPPQESLAVIVVEKGTPWWRSPGSSTRSATARRSRRGSSSPMYECLRATSSDSPATA